MRYSGLRFRYTRKSNFKGVDSEFLNLTKIAILRFGHLHEKLHSSENLIMFCKTFLFEFDFTVLGTCYSSPPEALEAVQKRDRSHPRPEDLGPQEPAKRISQEFVTILSFRVFGAPKQALLQVL